MSRVKSCSGASASKKANYSTNIGAAVVVPQVKYSNADLQKLQIISENKGKGGVYRWVNLINGNSYIGSSINLSRRLTDYYSIRFLEKEIKKNNSIIYRSLVKYGYSSFSLEIIEYCEPKKCIEREQYYLDLLKPEYNILKNAGSSLGFKHSEESKIWERLKVCNANPEYKAKRLAQLKISNYSKEHKEHLKRLAIKNKGRPKTEGSGSPSVSIEVLDLETGIQTIYPSISEAARAIGVTPASIFMAFKRQGESIIWVKKRRYKITKLSN